MSSFRNRPLTRRQKEAAMWLARGLSRKECAAKMGIVVETVDDYLHSERDGGVLQRLGFNDPARLAHLFIFTGDVQLGDCEG